MKPKQHTQEQIDRFNKMLAAYTSIQSDTTLAQQGLTYAEYQSMGFPIDALRYEGECEIVSKSLAEWFARYGMQMKLTAKGTYEIIL